MKTYKELQEIGIKKHYHSDGKWNESGTLLFIETIDGKYYEPIANKFKEI